MGDREQSDAFKAAMSCWQAGQGRDDITRRVLERAATRYFEKAIGMPGLFMRARVAGE